MTWKIIAAYYTTSSVSGQDELNLTLWLATRAGKMELSCSLEERVVSCKEHLPCYGVLTLYLLSFIDQAWGQDGWILASLFFCVFMDRDEVKVHKHAKKERGQYPAILISRLVNNPYIVVRLLHRGVYLFM